MTSKGDTFIDIIKVDKNILAIGLTTDMIPVVNEITENFEIFSLDMEEFFLALWAPKTGITSRGSIKIKKPNNDSFEHFLFPKMGFF